MISCALAAVLLLGSSLSALAFDKPKSGTTTVTMAVYPSDEAPPEVTISVGQSSWTRFLNTITFGLLFSDTQTVTISATDAESGVGDIWYLVRDTALTAESVQDSSLAWTKLNGNSFQLASYTKAVIYVKATDKMGNIGYYSSDGVIIQKCTVSASGVKLYMDSSKLPTGARAMIAAYDKNGKFCHSCLGTMTSYGWCFDSRIAEDGAKWKCFLYDENFVSLQEAIELTELQQE